MVNINEAYKQLTPEHQRELEDFTEFLLSREKKSIEKKYLKRNWSAALKGSGWDWKSAQEQVLKNWTQ